MTNEILILKSTKHNCYSKQATSILSSSVPQLLPKYFLMKHNLNKHTWYVTLTEMFMVLTMLLDFSK